MMLYNHVFCALRIITAPVARSTTPSPVPTTDTPLQEQFQHLNVSALLTQYKSRALAPAQLVMSVSTTLPRLPGGVVILAVWTTIAYPESPLPVQLLTPTLLLARLPRINASVMRGTLELDVISALWPISVWVGPAPLAAPTTDTL